MNNKKTKWIKKIFNLLLLIYTALFIMQKTGYYENSVRSKTIMTQKQMEKFEEDVATNKAVDIKDYLPKEKDYSNFVTKSANKVSNFLGDLLEKKTINILHFIKALFIG